jgi:hypothetical protein
MRAAEHLAGKQAKCPRCRASFQVPPPAAPPTQVNSPAGVNTPPSLVETALLSPPPAGGPRPPGAEEWPAIPGYTVLGELGRGAMGVLYRARQENLDRVVALKTVQVSQLGHPDALPRFEKEAVTVARLQHPNIVTAYDFGRHEGRLYFVMELLQGEDLEKRLSREGPLAEATAWGLARQAAAGLAHAAQQGIVHRDVKPANLILVQPPEGFPLPPGLPLVKITDFGLAMLASDALSSSRLTVQGTLLGTPVYMAPEQFAGAEADPRVDIYALGATVHHMLAGRPPFAGKTIWEIMTAKNQAEPVPLPAGVSADSADLLRAMMARDRDQRVGSYPELLRRIDRITGSWSGELTARPPAAPPKPGPARRTRPVPVLLAAGVGLGLLLAGVGVYLSGNRPSGAGKPGAPPAVKRGWSEPLFDGATLDGWVTVEGLWRPSADDEGGKVLAGKGVIRRPLPPVPNCRVGLNVALKSAEAVQVRFGFARKGGGAPYYALCVSPSGVYLARADGEPEGLAPLSEAVPFPKPGEDESPYRAVRLERFEGVWWAYFNDKPVGSAPAAGDEQAEVRLVAEGGTAYFEAIEIAELLKP